LSKRTCGSLLGLGLIVALSLPAAPAQARTIIEDTSTHLRRPGLDFTANVGLFGAYTHLGLGAWYSYPILPDGFLPQLNDAFYIEGGAAMDWFHTRYNQGYGTSTINCTTGWWRMTPMGGGRWDFHITPEFTAFGVAKLGWGVGFAENRSSNCTAAAGVDFSAPQLDIGVGGYWQFSDAWALRFELSSWPTVGVGTKL
jgi:hypothetical protein